VRTTWDEALATIGAKMNAALKSGDELSKKSIMHHVGRPNESGFTPRVWASLGQDCQNSHTNICSANGRTGSCCGPTTTAARLTGRTPASFSSVSSHAADAGHYFQQSAMRIAKARKKGAKLVVMDPGCRTRPAWLICGFPAAGERVGHTPGSGRSPRSREEVRSSVHSAGVELARPAR